MYSYSGDNQFQDMKLNIILNTLLNGDYVYRVIVLYEVLIITFNNESDVKAKLYEIVPKSMCDSSGIRIDGKSLIISKLSQKNSILSNIIKKYEDIKDSA